jgi:phosphatidylethanolamine-binding protein (PEBP) family uncharacterized protein
MRQAPKAILGGALVAALGMAMAGCGSDAPVAAKAPKIEVKSKAMVGERIPARYTCDGQDVSPPLEWGAVPAGVRQLALFLVGFRPKPGTKSYAVSVEWAVAGVNPALHRLAAGRLPAGAYLGTATGRLGQSYSLCPAKGTTVHYQFELYGVPTSAPIPTQFSGVKVLSSLNARNGPTRANAHGGFVAIYGRS